MRPILRATAGRKSRRSSARLIPTSPLRITRSRPRRRSRRLSRRRATEDWDIVAAEQAAGRIEATDRTFWFGFADDIVVRVRPTDVGSRVDVRSVSRVGVSDVGANAARIRAYLADLAEQIGTAD